MIQDDSYVPQSYENDPALMSSFESEPGMMPKGLSNSNENL
tara:strand:- start:251 stop:373 length:123 start_codon:yes stop_codon:yes gene_type:complete